MSGDWIAREFERYRQRRDAVPVHQRVLLVITKPPMRPLRRTAGDGEQG